MPPNYRKILFYLKMYGKWKQSKTRAKAIIADSNLSFLLKTPINGFNISAAKMLLFERLFLALEYINLTKKHRLLW